MHRLQTTDKLGLPQARKINRIFVGVGDCTHSQIQMTKTARKTSSFPCRCLLFAKSFSAVPSYSDENDFTKYTLRFSVSAQLDAILYRKFCRLRHPDRE